MFRKSKINYVLLSAYMLVGAVVLSAASFRYDGLIELRRMGDKPNGMLR